MNITQSVVGERNRALLSGDYSTYHAQATRRIQGLRRRLGVATPRGRKYSPKSPVTAENVAQNSQWVQLLLASAERAWADAMAMKSAQSPENTQKPMAGSTKKQIASRYKRAITYASNLVEVLSDASLRTTRVDLLEAKAYLAILKGGLDFEKSRWTSCIQNYSISRLVYVGVHTSTGNDIYEDLLDSTVDPSIKYAAYQSKLPRTKAVSDIAIENFPTSEDATKADIEELDSQAFVTTAEKAASTFSDAPTNLPTTINWRSRKVQIEDASISQALGTAQDKEDSLQDVFQNFVKGSTDIKALAASYEEVIDARQEAVNVTKAAIDELRSQGVDQGDSRIQSLQITRTAVNYAVIEWQIGRNRVLCGHDDGLSFDVESQKQATKPRKDGQNRLIKEESSGRKLARLRERVALYDSILQSLDAIKDLPGVVSDTELVKDVDSKKNYFRALKCLSIGRSHTFRGSMTNALALISRAGELVKQATSSSKSSSSNDATKLEITSENLGDSQKHILALTTQYRALVELEGYNAPKTATENNFKPSLIERFYLNQYIDDVDLTNLVNYPAKMRPIPVKPLFFDLAWNYIQYPGQAVEVVATPVEKIPEPKKEEKPAKKGWFGFGR